MTSQKWQPPRISVFTPFLRRFTDEKSRDVAETRELLHAVSSRHRATQWHTQRAAIDLVDATIANLFKEPPELVLEACQDFALSLFQLEDAIHHSVGNVDVAKLSLVELVDLRRFLRAQEHFLDHEDEAANLLVLRMQSMIAAVVGNLPKLDAPSPFTVPLINLVPHHGELIGGLLDLTIDDEVSRFGLFAKVGKVIDDHINDIYKINPDAPPKRKLMSIAEKVEDEGWGPQEAADKFLKGTPFHDFLMPPLPLKFDYETRFSHIHIIGGSGAGKTQLLQNMILHDLESDEPPTLIIVDSQSDLINKLSRLEVFHPDYGEHAGKLTIISPRDISHPPAINIFDVRRDRLSSYSPAMREQVTAGVIQTFDYLFTGLLGADLTAKQSVFFRFVARLMLALPETMGRNATILDMMNLMDDPRPIPRSHQVPATDPTELLRTGFPRIGFQTNQRANPLPPAGHS